MKIEQTPRLMHGNTMPTAPSNGSSIASHFLALPESVRGPACHDIQDRMEIVAGLLEQHQDAIDALPEKERMAIQVAMIELEPSICRLEKLIDNL